MILTAVINTKGSTGKSTTVVNCAYRLAQRGKRVAVIDFDNQNHVAELMGYSDIYENNAARLFDNKPRLATSMFIQSDYGFPFVPSTPEMIQVEDVINQAPLGHLRLFNVLKSDEALQQFDVVLLDCAGASNRVYESVLLAADDLIVPIIPSKLCNRVFKEILKEVKSFSDLREQQGRQPVVFRGVFFNIGKSNTNADQFNQNQFKEWFPNVPLSKSSVDFYTQIREAETVGIPLLEMYPDSKPALILKKIIDELFNDILERELTA